MTNKSKSLYAMTAAATVTLMGFLLAAPSAITPASAYSNASAVNNWYDYCAGFAQGNAYWSLNTPATSVVDSFAWSWPSTAQSGFSCHNFNYVQMAFKDVTQNWTVFYPSWSSTSGTQYYLSLAGNTINYGDQVQGYSTVMYGSNQIVKTANSNVWTAT